MSTSQQLGFIDSLIPGPVVLPRSGYWEPAVNEFTLSSADGRALVVYTGLFSNTFHAKGAVVVLPLPAQAQQIQLETSRTQWHVASPTWPNHPVFPAADMQLTEGINSIRAVFFVPASVGGHVSWSQPTQEEAVLPGVSLFLWTGLHAHKIPSDFSKIPLQNALNAGSNGWLRLGHARSVYPSWQWTGVIPQRSVWIFATALIAVLAVIRLRKLWLRANL